MDHYAVEIWNTVVKKHVGKNLTALAFAKCKLTLINTDIHGKMYHIFH